MTDVDHTLGETITSFRPSTMSSLEAKAFASSEDPEQEIRELSDAAERGSITARMRIGALLTGLGPQRWREARGYWLAALEECENWLEDYYGPRSKSGGVSAGTDQVLLETAAGAIHGMLGELAIRLESDEEAITHLERGVHYQHSESSLWLALLYKSRGRLDLAQFLLTSVLDDRASDAAYLLGDLLETKGLHDLADIYYRRAAAKGHARAASHVPAGATDGPVGYPDLTETISYGHGWSAEIHQLEGGVTIMWGDTEIRELEATSNLSGVEQLYIDSTTPFIYEEFETHHAMVADHRNRTFAVGSATKSGFIRESSTTIYTDAHVDVGIMDRQSGSFELHEFDTLQDAMEFVRLIIPLGSDR